jgi:hypothetical protein
MTASKPDMRVLAVGRGNALQIVGDPSAARLGGHEFVLCEMPRDSADALPVGCERDWCSPGFVVGVVTALAEAGIGKAGGPGVEQLAQREASWRGIVARVRNAVGERSIDPTSRVRSAVSRANALAQAVQSIGQTLGDMGRDIESASSLSHAERFDARREAQRAALLAISEIVESVAADVVAPTQTAREVLAAHGWRSDAPGDWAHADGRLVGRYQGRATVWPRADVSAFLPEELRAFAQLAEESQP